LNVLFAYLITISNNIITVLRPHRLWDPPSLRSNGYQGLFPLGQRGRGVKLTTHLHPVPRSRVHGILPPLPQNDFMAWCSVKS